MRLNSVEINTKLWSVSEAGLRYGTDTYHLPDRHKLHPRLRRDPEEREPQLRGGRRCGGFEERHSGRTGEQELRLTKRITTEHIIRACLRSFVDKLFFQWPDGIFILIFYVCGIMW